MENHSKFWMSKVRLFSLERKQKHARTRNAITYSENGSQVSNSQVHNKRLLLGHQKMNIECVKNTYASSENS